MKGLIALGANASRGMQLTAGLVRSPSPSPSPHPPPSPHPHHGPALSCSESSCGVLKGYGTENGGIVTDPVRMANQDAIGAPTSIADCCSRCHKLPGCEIFELGHGGCVPHAKGCTAKTINCFLIGGYKNVTRPNPDRVSGCARAAAPLPSAEENQVVAESVISQATLATFMLVRGQSAVITLPPYDRPMLSRPFVWEGALDPNADPGTPLGLAVLGNGSVFSREYTKAHVSLDCATFKSTITFK